MDREQAKQYVISRAADYLTPDGCKKGFICPCCGSGSGSKGTGITTKDGVHFTCWAGCFTNADIIDIIGLENGLSDYNEKLRRACDIFGVEISSSAGYVGRSTAAEDFREYTTHNTQPAPPAEEVDYTDFFLQANTHITDTEYHRGITLETLNRYKIGFVPEWTHPKAPNAPTSPRLIIPTSRTSYIARDTRGSLTPEQKQYAKSKVGKVHIFNARCLDTAKKPIYIVEGEIDALSVIDVGGEAVGLGSINNVPKFLTLLKDHKPTQPLIIALDNEEKAQVKVAEEKLRSGIEQLGIKCFSYKPYGEYKDANEYLQSDRTAFTEAVAKAEEAEREAEDAEREQLKAESALNGLKAFRKEIEESKRTGAFIPTGFLKIDALLDGGLYKGVYFVGAVSSLGKTSLVLQIADNIARAGNDVLIFSLEMASTELIAKSVSRLTLIKDMRENGGTANAKTTKGILTGTRYKDYNKAETDLIEGAIAEYSTYADHLYIHEGVGDIGVEEIRERVEKHIRITGKKPVVIVDYLQIVAPASDKSSDKQNTDKAVLELKRLSRDKAIPIIAISSFNRDNYTEPVNLTAFKESGAIEYTSDVLIGLQYDGMEYKDGEYEKDKNRLKRIHNLQKTVAEEAKAGHPIRIQVCVLKNRNGTKGSCCIDFYPRFNYFTDETVTKPGNGTEDNATPAEKDTPKLGKRDAERTALRAAYFKAEDATTRTAPLGKIADALDLTKKKVVNLISEYGGFTVDGETVRLEVKEELPPIEAEALPDELPW